MPSDNKIQSSDKWALVRGLLKRMCASFTVTALGLPAIGICCGIVMAVSKIVGEVLLGAVAGLCLTAAVGMIGLETDSAKWPRWFKIVVSVGLSIGAAAGLFSGLVQFEWGTAGFFICISVALGAIGFAKPYLLGAWPFFEYDRNRWWRIFCACVNGGMAFVATLYALALLWLALEFVHWAFSGRIVAILFWVGVGFLLAIIAAYSYLRDELRDARTSRERIEVYIAFAAILTITILTGVGWLGGLGLFVDSVREGPAVINPDNPIPKWREGITVMSMVLTFVLGPLMASSTVAGEGYQRPFASWREGAKSVAVLIILAIPLIGLSIFQLRQSSYCRQIQLTMSEQQKLKDEMVGTYNDHQSNIVTGVLVPNRSIADFATKLESIDLNGCPSELRLAFAQNIFAWREFGKFVERNSGVPGISKALISSGVSLLETHLIDVPDKVKAIEATELRLEELATKHEKRSNYLLPPWLPTQRQP